MHSDNEKTRGSEEESTPPSQVPLGEKKKSSAETAPSQLVSFGDRITYTFAHGKEVASIHYDRARGEIFYKGHNIRNMDIEEWQMRMIENFRKILEADEKGKRFAESYGRALDKVVQDKKRNSP